MSRSPASFKQADVTKAVKACVNAGVKVGRVEISAGKIIVIADHPQAVDRDIETSEELRKLL
ncbi:hypothetical protein [Bradyrhizobium sp. USDA 4502]